MDISKSFVALLFITSFLPVNAQIAQPDRYEIELGAFDNYFNIIPAQEDGLVLVRQTDESGRNGSIEWEVIKLDTNLQENFATTYLVDSKLNFTGYDYHNGKAYLLFNHGPYIKDDISLMEIDLENQSNRFIDITKEFAIELTEYEMIGESVVLAGYVNYRPTVMLYHMPSKKLKVLPGFYSRQSELLQLEIDDQRQVIRTLTTSQTLSKKNTVSIKTFNEEGELLLNLTLKPDPGINLLDGRASPVKNNAQYVAGTYSQLRSARKGKESFSMGIYVARLDADGGQIINYYNYADMENFFNFMKSGKQKRIKRKIERKKIKGKEVKFNYRLMVHDIMERDDGQFILLGEAYYPVFSTQARTTYINSFYSQRLSGYRYTHAVLFCFDKEGNHLWDNSFEINDVTSPGLVKYVNVDVKKDKLVLLYNFENEIKTKIIKGEEVLEGKSFNKIELKFKDDVAREDDSEMGGLKGWYDDNFYAYGVQHIKNGNIDSSDMTRKVFYINKINYK